MRIQIEPTDQTMLLDGVPVRCWGGVTEDGDQCLVFVHRVVTFTAEGEEQPPVLPGLIEVPYPEDVRLLDPAAPDPEEPHR